MSRKLPPLKRLQGAQSEASHPEARVWLSASAGTGKTHVLVARVLRLLLTGVDPRAILCLTFTKAGAAEMAERIHTRLAAWVRMKPADLRVELFALGEPNHDAALARARTLFATVIEAGGGGLRIQTIHAFCQTLLASFPAEADLAPGFRPLEGREAGQLARRVLGELLVEAEAGGRLGLIDDVQCLSRRLGEQKAEAYLGGCARDPDAMAALGPGIEARVRRALDLPAGDVEALIHQLCHDDAFDCAALRRIEQANRGWGTQTGRDHAERAAAFLAAAPEIRATLLQGLGELRFTKAGELRKLSAKLLAASPDYERLCDDLGQTCRELLSLRARDALAKLIAAGLRVGQAYALAYAEAKRRAGLVDFDDLIRRTVALLETPGMGDWVRYKLDQRFDHVLVDEAQDTNAKQWAIVAALAGEFLAGEGTKGQRTRTIFTVGDYKQAIFGFQGTDPREFAAARMAFGRHASEAQPILDLSLDRSFRSTPPVLALVDRVIEEIGGEALGLPALPEPHLSARAGPGRVTLLRPFAAPEAAESEDAGEEGWVDDATRLYAAQLARQIRDWLAEPLSMKGGAEPLRPQDVMVLVRKRGTLASLLVARLHAEGVPVAGVDRLRLDAPLAVKDLLAALRFAIQPEDDLTLAGLLVSPLFGWSQARLYAAAFERKASLRATLRQRGEHATADQLDAILAAADFTTPSRLLEDMLSGPLDGRRKLLSRLGPEARDPIDELLSAALAFEQETTPSLQRFLDWFDRGEVEIVRDPSAPFDAVRVMTVHGAKGLQAPLVILADATGDPELARAGTLDWRIEDVLAPVPVPRPRKDEMADAIGDQAEAAARRERQEHWRLLYVALTRAEERLVIGGALGPRMRGEPPKESWYTAIDRAMAGLGAEWEADALWSGARQFGGTPPHAPAEPPRVRKPPRSVPPVLAVPAWARRAAPEERRPPRPLTPSSLGADRVADPPPTPALRAAAERGRLLHALFERLPAVAPERRMAEGARWLAGQTLPSAQPELVEGPDDAARNTLLQAQGERRKPVRRGASSPAAIEALLADACGIIADPRFADLFGPEALAEAPIAAVVEGEVIAGTVDRLLVEPDRVRLIDFKTGRRAPRGLAEVPEHHLRQMGAYAAALAAIFPGRAIEAALLYTSGPVLIAMPADVLAGWKQGLGRAEQKQGQGG